MTPLGLVIMLLIAAFALTLAVLALRVRGGVAVDTESPSPWCAACGYSLYGLADDACCPECGGESRQFEPQKWRSRWRMTRYLAWVVALFLLSLPASWFVGFLFFSVTFTECHSFRCAGVFDDSSDEIRVGFRVDRTYWQWSPILFGADSILYSSPVTINVRIPDQFEKQFRIVRGDSTIADGYRVDEIDDALFDILDSVNNVDVAEPRVRAEIQVMSTQLVEKLASVERTIQSSDMGLGRMCWRSHGGGSMKSAEWGEPAFFGLMFVVFVVGVIRIAKTQRLKQ